MSTVWDELLTEEQQRVLDPGPGTLDPTPDVLVVGGGVIGLATAVFCRRAGIERVTVIERGRLAAEASGRAAGSLTPGIHALLRPGPFVRLAYRGLELHRELDREWDGEIGLRDVDSLVAPPALPPPELLDRAGGALVDGEEARALEPEFGELDPAIHLSGHAAVRPLHLAIALARRAGTVATRVEMTDVESSSDGAIRVRTSHGDVAPGAVVVATGIVDAIPARQTRVKGHMLATEPAPFRLRTMPAGIIGLVQLTDGRIVAGGTFDYGDDGPDIRDHAIEAMLMDMHRLVPRSKDLRVTHRWTCFRPTVLDEIPVIDRVPGFDNVWANAGHFRTGLLAAPAAAELVTGWITTGQRPTRAADFGLDRFA